MDSEKCLKLLSNICNDVETIDFPILIQTIESELGIDLETIKSSPLLKELGCMVDNNSSISWKYSCYIYHILLQLMEKIDLEIVSVYQINTIISVLNHIRPYGLNIYLLEDFKKLTSNNSQTAIKNYDNLKASLQILLKLLKIKAISSQAILNDVILDYMSGVFTLFLQEKSIECNFNYLFKREVILKNLMLLKSVKTLPKDLQIQLHKELLKQISLPGGYSILSQTLLGSIPANDEVPNWRRNEVIANIIGGKGHPKKFYFQVLEDIFRLYLRCLSEENESPYIQTCITSMNKIYSLGHKELNFKIEAFLFKIFEDLHRPKDYLLQGLIVAEGKVLSKALYLNYRTFNGSNHASLNSSLLVPFIPILIQIFSFCSQNQEDQKYISSIVTFCLVNRAKKELESILDITVFKNENSYLKFMQKNVIFENGDFKILHEQTRNIDETKAFIEILRISNHNILIFNIFMIFLKFFQQSSEEKTEILVENPDEVGQLISEKFFKKYVIIEMLTELINFRGLHQQLYENPSDILQFIKNILQNVQDENMIILVLSIFKEFLKNQKTKIEIETFLESYKKSEKCTNEIRKQIDIILNEDKIDASFQTTPYKIAISLCSDDEAYCKVYGINSLLKLIKEKDPETILNKHSLLLLAIDSLKNVESYAFLSSVRLLVGLLEILEPEVIDTLIKEFKNDENDVDFRLKIGEASIKVMESLGPMAFKYREVLINTFLVGLQHNIKEFRTSSLSNLGNICKIFTYQVHNFFYEMFSAIQHILNVDDYLPCRRAATLILRQLIEGMDKQVDLEDHLLEVYRLLKHVIQTESDITTKVQAGLALEKLQEKTKEFLFPEQKLEKAIKIFGIKDDDISNNGEKLFNKITELN